MKRPNVATASIRCSILLRSIIVEERSFILDFPHQVLVEWLADASIPEVGDDFQAMIIAFEVDATRKQYEYLSQAKKARRRLKASCLEQKSLTVKLA